MADSTETRASLQAENAQLRQRVAELEQASNPETITRIQAENVQLRQRVAELEQTQALLQSVIDNVPATIYAKDLHGRFLLVNKHWTTAINMEPAQVLGKYDSDLFPPDIADHWRKFTAAVVASGTTVEREEEFPLDDGMHTYISAQFPVYDAHMHLYAVGGIATDITERKRMETSLRESQALLQSLIDNASMLVMVKDAAGRYLLVNRLAATVVHLTPEQMVGKTDYDLMPAEVADLYIATDRDALTTGTIVTFESDFPTEDGVLTYLTVKFPLFNAQGESYAVGIVSTDITERKRMEAERIAMQEQMITAQQTALRELSTPLIPISDKVVIMPLIGTIDSQRAQQIMETLLEGVARYQAQMVILDITGVQVVDSQVANAFIQAAQAVKLLGSQVMVTGIQPQIAHTLVQLGVNLTGILTYGTLQTGIAHALRTYVARKP